MEDITGDEALEIANLYLANQTHVEISFIEDPRDIVIYGLEKPEDCYCFYVTDTQVRRIGGSYVICISKADGKVYSDFVGE
jgi:hypothetical protein